MASHDPEALAEAQRETIRALALLTEQLRAQSDRASEEAARQGARPRPPESLTVDQPGRPLGPEFERTLASEAAQQGARQRPPGSLTVDEPGRPLGPEFERTLESTAQAIGELGRATAANAQALTGLSHELGGLPALLAGLVGGAKDGGSLLGGVLKSGLGLVPLGLKIAGLFGRGSKEQPAPITRFLDPPSLALEVANTDDILAGFPRVDRDQRGELRVAGPQRTVVSQPQITVNVSAMDSRSFLDRSEDIARAVREAMLHMHPVNDLISEL